MADRSLDFYQALVQIDERFDADSIADNGAGATDGDYTQRGPRAGVPEDQGSSDMVLQATGTPSQDGDLEIVASRAGMPDDRAELIWRDVDGGDSTSNYKGWEGPELVTGWEAIQSHTAASSSAQIRPSVITLQSGRALAVAGQNGTSASGQFPIYIMRYDPASGWSSLSDLSPGNGATQHCDLLQLPDGKVLIFLIAEDTDQVDVRVSEDDGATWAPYALRVLKTPVADTDVRQLAVAYSARQIVLFVGYHDGSTFDMAQYASSDLGKSFAQITASYKTTSASADQGEAPSVTGVPGGGFALVYKNNQTSPDRYTSVAVPDAFTAAAELSSRNLGSTGANDTASCAAFTRTNGDVLYLINEDDDNDGGDITIHWSADGGDNVYKQRSAANLDQGNSASGNRLYGMAYAEVAGRGLLLCRYETATAGNNYAENSVVCVYLGGYTNMTQPAADIDTAEGWGRDYYPGWTNGPSGQVCLGPWLPVADPDDLTHSTTGSGGTVTMTAAKATFATTSASRYWTIGSTSTIEPGNAGTADAIFAEVEFAVTAGGSQTAFESGFEVRGGKAGVGALVLQVRADTAGFRIHDLGATTDRATVSLDMTTIRKIRVVLDIDSENYRAWYATSAHAREWTEITAGDLTDTGGAAGVTHLTFGHHASTTTTTEWVMAAIGYAGCSNYAPRTVSAIGDAWSNPTDLAGIPASSGYQMITDGVSVRAVDGPACIDDSWRVRADYAYPIASILPSYKSSPDQPWRSVADNAQMLIPFDPEPQFSGNAGTEVKAFLFAFVNCNIKEAYIEGYNGTLWTQVARLRASDNFTGLKYLRSGRMVQVDTGQSQTADRYFFRELHAGDTFDFGTSDPVVLRKIAHNTEGAFTDSATVRPTIVLADDDLSGSEPSSGTGSVWRKDFAAVVYQVTDCQMWRIRIPAHKTADGYYQIGSFVIGSPAIFGTPNDRGFSNALRFNVDYNDAPSGRRSFRRRGKPRRSVEFALANTAVDLNNVQADSPVPHYVTPDGSTPLAAVADTSRQIEGIVHRCTEQGLPTVYVSRLDKLSGSTVEALNEPLRWIYGRLRTNPRRDHVVGTEGVSEVERLNTVTVEEEI